MFQLRRDFCPIKITLSAKCFLFNLPFGFIEFLVNYSFNTDQKKIFIYWQLQNTCFKWTKSLFVDLFIDNFKTLTQKRFLFFLDWPKKPMNDLGRVDEQPMRMLRSDSFRKTHVKKWWKIKGLRIFLMFSSSK